MFTFHLIHFGNVQMHGCGCGCVVCWMLDVKCLLLPGTHCSICTFFIAKNQVCGTSRNGFFYVSTRTIYFTCISKTLDSIEVNCKLPPS
jgi:hypothetical protein